MLQTTPFRNIPCFGASSSPKQLINSSLYSRNKMKKGYSYSVAVAFNAICLLIFFLLLSYSMNVEGMRPLKDQSAPTFISSIINRAYSGPSHRGRGH